MKDKIMPIAIFAALAIGYLWAVVHYALRWDSATRTLTVGDGNIFLCAAGLLLAVAVILLLRGFYQSRNRQD